MAHYISIELEQTWDTLDAAVGYFEGLAKDLKVLKGFQDPPVELFFAIEQGEDPSDHTIYIKNL